MAKEKRIKKSKRRIPTKKLALKKKKKSWMSILAPKEFNSMELGECYVTDGQEALKKNLVVSLSNLIGNMKKQNVKVTFKVVKVENGKAIAEIIGYNLVNSYVKRISRKERSKIEMSFDAETKDGIKVRIKPIIVTKNKVLGSALTALRKGIETFVHEEFKKNDYDSIINSLFANKFQKDLSASLKKTAPVQIADIKTLKKKA